MKVLKVIIQTYIQLHFCEDIQEQAKLQQRIIFDFFFKKKQIKIRIKNSKKKKKKNKIKIKK